MRKALLISLSICLALILSSPVFAQKGGKGGKSGKSGKNQKGGHVENRHKGNHRGDNHRDGDRDHKTVIKINRHPHHWGNELQWSVYAGENGVAIYYGRRYTSCYNFYYPSHSLKMPGVYHPWETHWYFYSATPCPVHKYIHEGYCEYYFDDDGGCEVFYFAP